MSSIESAAGAFGRLVVQLVPVSNALAADVASVVTALERARVVAVLDGWAARHPTVCGQGVRVTLACNKLASGDPSYRLSAQYPATGADQFLGEGPTPDAARAAVAEAIEAGDV